MSTVPKKDWKKIINEAIVVANIANEETYTIPDLNFSGFLDEKTKEDIFKVALTANKEEVKSLEDLYNHPDLNEIKLSSDEILGNFEKFIKSNPNFNTDNFYIRPPVDPTDPPISLPEDPFYDPRCAHPAVAGVLIVSIAANNIVGKSNGAIAPNERDDFINEFNNEYFNKINLDFNK